MKQLGFLCIFIALLAIGYGVFLIVASSMNFIPDAFTICKLAIGGIMTLFGATVFIVSVYLLVSDRKEKALEKKNEDGGEK